MPFWKKLKLLITGNVSVRPKGTSVENQEIAILDDEIAEILHQYFTSVSTLDVLNIENI